ncbi:MAG: thioredoxin family protein [Candidatus Aminicenantes bacterium]|nr:thioredoxin family protein [Candidatus Aminicenantes bacterium]
MPMLDDKVIKELKESFKGLQSDVVIKYFTQEMECQFCKETKELLQELEKNSASIKLEIFDFVKDKSEAQKYGIDKIPATVVMGDTDRGIRFYGIPAGYEFGTLVEAIKMVSNGKADLSQESKTFLDGLKKDIHLQVFVTPTCPYCAGAVVLAHQMAFYSDRVKADMVEATEFPHLSQKYQVMGVPKTVINEKTFQEGAAPENVIIEKIKSVL